MAAILLQTKGPSLLTAPLSAHLIFTDMHKNKASLKSSEYSPGLLVQCTVHVCFVSGPTAGFFFFFLPEICPEIFEAMETFGFPNVPSQGAPQLETEGKVTLQNKLLVETQL